MTTRTRDDFTWSKNTDTSAIHSMIQYTNKAGMSLIDVMGYTAHAFRIIIDREAVEVGSYSAFNWPLYHAQQLNNLGFMVQTLGRPSHIPPTPEELEEAIASIQTSLDRGVPALSWDLFIPEWGLIYGYDDENKVLRCRDVRKDGDLPYEKLGRGEVTEMYVLTITGSHPVDKRTMLKGALQMAATHAKYVEVEDESHRVGLDAYDAWIEAFTKRTVDPFGNAVNSGKVWDTRAFAAEFLLELSLNWEGETLQDDRLRMLAKEAAEQYGEIAERLVEMRDMFPFPQGGDPNSNEQAQRALTLLHEAKAAEIAGVALLERMLEALE
ncbi:hypothetical protein H8B09_26175 [Paenibacillus sp. PR3]|uniref:DUF4872 domain-containing protein n=1 Tax=Paenibacillus terricola TaxID=2763503 RepID=A0ABR8N317_9BACL|nr:hypothetical protein [Paenibacillus terricola]MBD3922270.1 hypothetical protein [Paenibacillus terricola]